MAYCASDRYYHKCHLSTTYDVQYNYIQNKKSNHRTTQPQVSYSYNPTQPGLCSQNTSETWVRVTLPTLHPVQAEKLYSWVTDVLALV